MIPTHLTDAAEAIVHGHAILEVSDVPAPDAPRVSRFELGFVEGPAPTHVVIGLGPMFVHVEVAWNRDDAEAIVAELMPHPSVAQVTTLPIVDRRG